MEESHIWRHRDWPGAPQGLGAGERESRRAEVGGKLRPGPGEAGGASERRTCPRGLPSNHTKGASPPHISDPGTLAHLRGSLCSHHPWQSRTLGTDHLLSSPHSVILARNSEPPVPVSCGQFPPTPLPAEGGCESVGHGEAPGSVRALGGTPPGPEHRRLPRTPCPGIVIRRSHTGSGGHVHSKTSGLILRGCFQRMGFSPAPGVILDLRG